VIQNSPPAPPSGPNLAEIEAEVEESAVAAEEADEILVGLEVLEGVGLLAAGL
jgi:hypothetical protein